MKNFHRLSGEIFKSEELLFPGKITRGEGEIDKINAGPDRAPFLFSDKYVMKAFGRALLKNNPSMRTIIFAGEVCPAEYYRVKKLLSGAGAGCLYALGGGKVMDLAKLVKNDLKGMKLVNIPTSAATCAALTPVSVMYDRDGAYMDTMDSAVPDEVVVDYNVFYKLPMPFFAAGAADALAKYYETYSARKAAGGPHAANDDMVFGMVSACKERLKGLIYLNWENPDEAARRKLADLNIIFSGLASCAGRFTVTGLLAHALSHAATHIPAARKYLHGEHAAAGLVIQEGFLKNKKHSEEIMAMFGIMDLPVTLSGIGIKKEDLKVFYKAFENIDNNEKISVYTGKKLVYNKVEKYL